MKHADFPMLNYAIYRGCTWQPSGNDSFPAPRTNLRFFYVLACGLCETAKAVMITRDLRCTGPAGRLSMMTYVFSGAGFFMSQSFAERWENSKINWVHKNIVNGNLGLIYGRYLQFRFLKWPLMLCFITVYSRIQHSEICRLKQREMKQALETLQWCLKCCISICTATAKQNGALADGEKGDVTSLFHAFPSSTVPILPVLDITLYNPHQQNEHG